MSTARHPASKMTSNPFTAEAPAQAAAQNQVRFAARHQLEVDCVHVSLPAVACCEESTWPTS